MTKKNPDDSVREEQSVADQTAIGSEDATQAENAHEPDSSEVNRPSEDEEEKKLVSEVPDPEVTEKAVDQPARTEHDEIHDFEDMELPQVDYSGYSKHELVETLSLIIENRPTVEIRDDVERIKILFYKKLKTESEERKNKFLEEGGKLEEYRIWVDPDDARVKHLLEKYKENGL